MTDVLPPMRKDYVYPDEQPVSFHLRLSPHDLATIARIKSWGLEDRSEVQIALAAMRAGLQRADKLDAGKQALEDQL